PAETNPYSPTPAGALPAPDHRRGRHFRTTRWRTRAGWEPPPASLPVHSSGAPSLGLAIRFVKPLKQFNEALGHPLIHNLTVDQSELHPYLCLDIGAELNHRIFFGFLCVHGSYSWSWVVRVHRFPRARGVLFPLHSHSCKKLTNVRQINRFRGLELFSKSALSKVTTRR